jgi:hypothetical protein
MIWEMGRGLRVGGSVDGEEMNLGVGSGGNFVWKVSVFITVEIFD